MANAKIEGNSALVTWPVDVWFNGSRTFKAVLDFGGRAITSIQLDPACRFPDRDPERQRVAETRGRRPAHARRVRRIGHVVTQ